MLLFESHICIQKQVLMSHVHLKTNAYVHSKIYALNKILKIALSYYQPCNAPIRIKQMHSKTSAHKHLKTNAHGHSKINALNKI